MGFSRQEYWSGLSFPAPGDLIPPRLYLEETGEHSLTGQAGRGPRGFFGEIQDSAETQGVEKQSHTHTHNPCPATWRPTSPE